MEQLGLSTEEGSVGRVGGARERKRHVPKRRSVLYGTRKTNINTSRFKYVSHTSYSVVYTGMDITCLYTSFYDLICVELTHSGYPCHVERNNYVPLFGVDPIECRLTRYYVIRDVIAI